MTDTPPDERGLSDEELAAYEKLSKDPAWWRIAPLLAEIRRLRAENHALREAKTKLQETCVTQRETVRRFILVADQLINRLNLREETPSITCPRCRMTSYNRNDIRDGYCGNCHEWTTPRPDQP